MNAGGSVYERLRELVLTNEIAPGERVVIDALARRLGVSQTPVREAVHRLEGDGLVVRSGSGYRTTELLDLDGLRELFEFRLLVDLWAVRAAAVDRLANPAAALLRDVDGLSRELDAGGDVRRALVAHDTRFHAALIDAAGNRVAARAYAGTHGHLHAFRLYPADTDGRVTAAEHAAVARAVGACDPGAAEEAMRAHLLNAFDRFARAFAGGAGPAARPPVPARTRLHRAGA
ncbi:GntR family transcriptional regulator [Kineococcus sp. SYSU DK004]|uniref:GntR family transcriptional regulator n=1 Tax=Kineococcus sp. SYSU DK004 TaxID=3383125 RepID=UPI003D7C503D